MGLNTKYAQKYDYIAKSNESAKFNELHLCNNKLILVLDYAFF